MEWWLKPEKKVLIATANRRKGVCDSMHTYMYYINFIDNGDVETNGRVLGRAISMRGLMISVPYLVYN